MKALSVLMTCLLFAGANQLATTLKRAGALPADQMRSLQTSAPSHRAPIHHTSNITPAPETYRP